MVVAGALAGDLLRLRCVLLVAFFVGDFFGLPEVAGTGFAEGDALRRRAARSPPLLDDLLLDLFAAVFAGDLLRPRLLAVWDCLVGDNDTAGAVFALASTDGPDEPCVGTVCCSSSAALDRNSAS